MPNPPTPEAALARLLAIMARLRDPVGGCPWDQVQDFSTIAPYTIEEAHEVADAIRRGPDFPALLDELGDLLFQVVYHAQMARRPASSASPRWRRRSATRWCGGIRMCFRRRRAGSPARRRRPEPRLGGAEGQGTRRPGRDRDSGRGAIRPARPHPRRQADPPSRAGRLRLARRRAACWTSWRRKRPSCGPNCPRAEPARLADEVGDLLFVLANLARKLDLDPEACLRGANAKFERRFQAVEQHLATEGLAPADVSLAVMEAAWQAVKATERQEM